MKSKTGKQFFSMTFEFLEIYMTSQADKSPATVKSYGDALTVFRKYLLFERNISIAKFTFEACTRDLVLEFMDYLKKRGNKPGTRNQRLTVIKTYLWFAADKDIALQSIALQISRIRSVKNPATEKPIISEQSLALLLQQPDNSRMGVRDRTIMILLYDSAIRLAEILSLKVTDVCLDRSDPHIRVMGKGHRERVVAITELTLDHIIHYLKIYHSEKCPNTELLFYTTIKGQTAMMSEGNVERFVREYADQVKDFYPDIPERVHPHMLRRTRATNLYQDGIDLELVSRVLGHAKLETTRIYAKPSLDMMRNAMESNAPPAVQNEVPLWENASEDEMARMCGLR